jgi:hypothetical protein
MLLTNLKKAHILLNIHRSRNIVFSTYLSNKWGKRAETRRFALSGGSALYAGMGRVAFKGRRAASYWLRTAKQLSCRHKAHRSLMTSRARMVENVNHIRKKQCTGASFSSFQASVCAVITCLILTISFVHSFLDSGLKKHAIFPIFSQERLILRCKYSPLLPCCRLWYFSWEIIKNRI